MTLSCHRTGILLERRASGLEPGDGLLLERHLGGCDSCRVDARLVSAFVGVARAAADVHDRPARAHAMVDRALAAVSEPERRTSDRRRGLLLALAAVGAAAAGVLIALLVHGAGSEPDGGEPAIAGADRVLSGEATADGRELAAGARVGAGQRIETSRGAVLSLGPGRVELGIDTAVAWNPDTRTVVLESGDVRVEVDSIPGRQYQVQTARFAVVVAGTRFRVDESGVRVETGSVRILGPGGDVLVESLGAGRVWSVSSPAPPVSVGPDDRADGAPEKDSPADGGPTPAAKPETRAPPAAALLRRARNALAGGDVSRARRHVDAVRAANPTRAQRAEARTILAECALVAGQTAEAARLYVGVAEKFRDLAAGENALFAAARLRARTSKLAAGQLYERYLKRYPNGRFRVEARAALEAAVEEK